jgi:serine/threonine protein kinase
MDRRVLTKEVALIKKHFENCAPVDFCQLNLKDLEHPFPNRILVHQATCAFSGFLPDSNVTTLKPVSFDFIQEQKKISDRIYVVKINGVKFLMKEEEYTRTTDHLIHEYFVGLQINKLNIPTFARIIGAFGCTPELGSGVCEYSGSAKTDVNYILYQYIEGPTLAAALSNKSIGTEEGWYLMNIVYDSIVEAGDIGLIHQDLHANNVILQDLGQPTEYTVGTKKYVSRYLPKIIDFGRSQITVNNERYSPIDTSLKLPAKSTYYDLIYLLIGYAASTGAMKILNQAFPKLNTLRDAIDRIDDKQLVEIYRKYKTVYNTYIPENPVAILIEDPTPVTKDNPACPVKEDVPTDKESSYEDKADYLRDQRLHIYLLETMTAAFFPDKEHLKSYFILMNKYKYPFEYSNEFEIITHMMDSFRDRDMVDNFLIKLRADVITYKNRDSKHSEYYEEILELARNKRLLLKDIDPLQAAYAEFLKQRR